MDPSLNKAASFKNILAYDRGNNIIEFNGFGITEAESRKDLDFYQFYVPRDESFSDRKVATFVTMEILFTIAQALKPSRQKFNQVSLMRMKMETKQKQSWYEKVLEYLQDKWADLNHLEKVLKVVIPNLLKDFYDNAQTVQRIHDAQSKDGIYVFE